MLDNQQKSKTWLLRSTAEIVLPIAVGEQEVDINGVRYSLNTPFNHDGDEIEIYNSWRIDVIEPFRPLFVFTAFGARSIFSMLDIAIKSLISFADLSFDVLIITRKDDLEKVNDVAKNAEAYGFVVHVRSIEASKTYDYAMARYRLAEWPEFLRYGPCIYLDTDIMCNRSLIDFVAALTEPNVVHVAEENWSVFLENDYFGRSLFLGDGQETLLQERTGLSSGTLATRDFDTLAKFGRMVLEVSRRWHEEWPEMFVLYDQPICVYVLEKLRASRKTLQRWVTINGNVHDPVLADRRGLIHFCGGVGNNTPKLDMMTRYASAIGLDHKMAYYRKLQDRRISWQMVMSCRAFWPRLMPRWH